MKKTLPTLLTASLLLAACAGGPGRPDGDGPPGREGGGGQVIAQMQEQLQTTADALKLNASQLPLWDTYQERVGALLADQMKLTPYRSRQDALQQIGQKVDTVRNRLAAMEEIQDAAGKLYAALDGEQKKTADRLLAQTVPALYSGFGSDAPRGNERNGPPSGGRGGPGGMGGPGGGMSGSMGGGMGRF